MKSETIIGKERIGKRSDNKLLNYKCKWCNNQFKHCVGTLTINNDNYSKGSTITTQVQCPYCKNMLKSYEDAL